MTLSYLFNIMTKYKGKTKCHLLLLLKKSPFLLSKKWSWSGVWVRADMEFVKNFTPPDFQAKNFTPSISPNFNSFSDKNTKKWVKMEKFTLLAKILHCRRHWRHWQIPTLSSNVRKAKIKSVWKEFSEHYLGSIWYSNQYTHQMCDAWCRGESKSTSISKSSSAQNVNFNAIG